MKKKKHSTKTVKDKDGASGENGTTKTGKGKDKNENADSKDAEEDKNETGNTNNSVKARQFYKFLALNEFTILIFNLFGVLTARIDEAG